MRQFMTIYRKELTDALRDRRAMAALAYFVIGAPLSVLVIFYLISLSDDGRPTTLYVDGLEQAPGLAAFIEKRGIVVEPYEMDGSLPSALPENVDAILKVPDDYAERLEKGENIEARLFVDESGKDGIERGQAVRQAILGYGGYISSIRLVSRGIPTILVQPISVEKVDVSDENFLSRFMSEFLLLMVIMAPFYAGMSIAIDALAGERERNSLQSLLALPVSARTLTLGKWAVVATFGVFGTMGTAIILFLELAFMPKDLMTFSVYTDPLTLVLLILQLVPLAMFIGGLQMYLSVLAKSFREAQTLLSIVILVPFGIAYIKVIADDKLPEFVRYFPVIADMESASSLVFGGSLSLPHFALSLVVSLVGIAAALTLTIRRLDSERLLDES